MKRVLIVDGYNIVNSWPELVRLKKRSLQAARDKLVELLANYAAYTGQEVLVVFDAHHVKGALGSQENVNGVTVVFSREAETADQVIERMVGEYVGVPGQEVYVATSDWIEQRIVFGRGAYRIPARELYTQVEAALEKMKEWEREQAPAERMLEERLTERVRRLLDALRRRK